MNKTFEVHELSFECVQKSKTSQKEWFCQEIDFSLRDLEIFGDGTIYALHYPVGTHLVLTTVIKLEVPNGT